MSGPPEPSPDPVGLAVLRARDVGGAQVTFFELFFDLVFVFAITQLSHRLLEHLTYRGALETLLLLLAVWWAWMYTCWTTNWFDPDNPTVRLMLVGVMIAGLLMTATLPAAFGDRGLWFAASYVALQSGRTLFVTIVTRSHPLGPNFQRILFWTLVPGALWIGGAFVDDPTQRGLVWLLAIGLEYLAPWHGYATPILGRSSTADWNIDGDHMAERCRLFIIIALGESVLVTGATLSDLTLNAETVTAFVVAFAAAVALWWIYFDHTAGVAAERIVSSEDPGRLARSAYTFIHIVMVAGIIVSAVADEMTIAHPTGHVSNGLIAVALGGPALFIAGHAFFKRVVFGHYTRARIVAIVALAALAPVAHFMNPLALSVASTVIVVALALWDVRSYRAHQTAKAGIPTQRDPADLLHDQPEFQPPSLGDPTH